jgi:hypothetical protein
MPKTTQLIQENCQLLTLEDAGSIAEIYSQYLPSV